MSDTALFVGWGSTHPGREPFAFKHYAEWVEILTQLKAAGEIEEFETVVLAPYGGELDGFTLIYGAPEKLAQLPMREDLHRLRLHATLDHAKFVVVPAVVGDGVEREYMLLEEIVPEYAREPALAEKLNGISGRVPAPEPSHRLRAQSMRPPRAGARALPRRPPATRPSGRPPSGASAPRARPRSRRRARSRRS